MDWQNLLDRRRLCDTNYIEKPDRPTFIQDADRITFSAPFRRLANNTQVHPLYENDHLHHRLIHSVETASVGRSLGIAVGDWLEREHGLDAGEKHVVAGMTQAACLAHDIGNPPFGHPGRRQSEAGSRIASAVRPNCSARSRRRFDWNSRISRGTRRASGSSEGSRCTGTRAACGSRWACSAPSRSIR